MNLVVEHFVQETRGFVCGAVKSIMFEITILEEIGNMHS